MDVKFEQFDINTLLELLRQHIQSNQGTHKWAVVWRENDIIKMLSHEELVLKANKLACAIQKTLRQRKETKNFRIGVWLPRTGDYIATFLGIWIAGGVYVPTKDVSVERLESNAKLKEDFRNRLTALKDHLVCLITNHAGMLYLSTNKMDLGSAAVCCIEQLTENDYQTEEMILPNFNANSEAYVFCSSGTTGKPKIIAIPYEGIGCRVESIINSLKVDKGSCILNYTGFDFDPSLMEVFLSIYSGGPLIMVPEEVRHNPLLLYKYCEQLTQQHIPLPHHAIMVPSVLACTPSIFPAIKSILVTGEKVTFNSVSKWIEEHPELLIDDGYGSTETTWGATITEIPRGNATPIFNISKPMKGIEIYLRSVEGSEMSSSELIRYTDKCELKPGKYNIFVSGNGLGWYIDKDRIINEDKNFLTVPAQGKRYFNSHDVVECLNNGQMNYLGRDDRNIRIAGTFVSLEVLETKIDRSGLVEDCALVNYPGTEIVFLFVKPKKEGNYSPPLKI